MRMIRTAALTLLPIAAALGALNATAGGLTGVPSANAKVTGQSAPNILSPELDEVIAAQGSLPLENPSDEFKFYGYAAGTTDVPNFVPPPGFVFAAGVKPEATKTEPDKNTYLVLPGQHGPDKLYEYGRRFLYQGHEAGPGGHSYITRINLDADAAHRVTLLATTDIFGNALPPIDGSTWDPFTGTLLFSSEAGKNGGVWQATVDFPSTVTPMHASMGRGGYEGMQIDSAGNVWIVEDVGGSTVNGAKQPNSFIYRFVPTVKSDLSKGKLQALQVISLRTGQPIVFHSGQVLADALSDDQLDLHTYGKTFATKWVTIHDTAVDNTSFDANAAAKAAGATPFKRPENGQFRPASGFREFYFDATGDTNANTAAGETYGGFGAVFKLVQASPSADTGTLSLFYRSNKEHSGFDNVAFWDANRIVFVEDAGDGLHSQRSALDSAYMFDVTLDYGNPANQPVRILAQGRDISATIDSGLGNQPGFQNDGDNEITGLHVSDGDPGVFGLLGSKIPTPFRSGWRVFYTQQHGDNVTWEIIRKDD